MKIPMLDIVLYYVFCLPFVFGGDGAASESKGKSATADDLNLSFFHRAFKIKRAQQLEAVKNILAMQDYAKQYQLIKIITQNIFKTLQKSKIDIAASDYIPGDSFPTDKETMTTLALILENTAFFGDILLRLPDITHEIYRSSKEWKLLAKWGVSFTNETGLYDELDTKLINLMAQELRLVPKDPNYTNPYTIAAKLEQAMAQDEASKQTSKSKKKKQKKKKRGPRLSGEL